MENREHCEYIAKEIERVTSGDACKCPKCGEIITPNFELTDGGEYCYSCSECGFSTDDQSDFDEYSLYDYFANALDIEYRVNSGGAYRSVSIMVACGGPNIYVDTADKLVKLFWWTERAEYPLSYDAADEIDAIFEELWEMNSL